MAASMHETYRSGLGALSSFSNMLNELFDSFDEQLHEAKDGVTNNANEILASKDTLSLHELRLRKLEAETEEQRKIVENAMKQVVGMEKSIDLQLSDATRELHKEIIIQRTATKMDMSNLRGKLQSSMSEAMGIISDSTSRSALFVDNSLNEFDFSSASTNDGLQHLLKRITRIEENIGLQHSINNIIGKSMGSAEMVQAVYDSLFDQVTALSTELAVTKQENTHLKRVVAELKAQQDWQDKQLVDIMNAFNDKAAMQTLKIEIAHGDRFPPAPVNLEPPAAIEKSPEEQQLEREIAAAHNAKLKKGERKKKKAQFKLQPQFSIREDLGEDDDSITKEDTKNDETGEANADDEYEKDDEDDEEENNDDVKQEGDNTGNEGEDDDDMFGEDMPSTFHNGPRAGGSFLKASAFETASINKYEQALNKLTTLQSEGQFQLTELQRDVDNRVGELETGMATFRRIAFVIDDLKAGFEAVKQRVEVVTGGESVDDKLKQSTFTKIAALKGVWSRILNELTFALGNLGDSIPDIDNAINTDYSNSNNNNSNPDSAYHSLISATDSVQREQDSKLFFRKAKELAKTLETALEDDMAFEPYGGDNLPATLDRLLPTLEKIYEQSLTMLAMDEAARKSSSLDYCFDDLLCADLTPSLRLYVSDACKACLPILDEGIHKVLLVREMKRLLKEVDRKADRVALLETESSTRHILQSKVDLAEFKAVCSRFASSTELQRLQAQVMEGRAIGSGSTSYAGAGHSGKEQQVMAVNLQEQPAFIEMTSRFDALVSVLQDVQGSVRRMVPKEEVAEALRALILEIKTMRRTFVPHPLFKEAMKTKADAREIDRLLKVITETLGDLNLTSADFSGQAAAFHAKCLLCDKPVTSQRARTVRALGVGPMQSLSSPQLPSIDQHAALTSAVSQLLPALASSVSNGGRSPQAAKNKLRVASEVAVVRTSIDPLPELTDSIIDSPRGGAYAQPDQQQLAQGSYKQRIRSSAGGGIGPGHKQQDGR